MKVPEPDKRATAPSEAGGADAASQGGQPQEGVAAADEITPEARQLADSYFERAAQATVRGNFDYALHLYMEGLRINPKDIEKGHKGLRDCAIRRAGQGKGLGLGLGSIFAQAKGAVSQMLGRGKDTLLDLVAAVSRDPQNVMLLTQTMQTARRLGYIDLAIWYGEQAAEETLKSKRPQKQIFTTLADMYESQERFREAVNALTQAVKIDPTDRALDKRARDLTAAHTIQEGKLESISDFHEMIRDRRQATVSATQQVMHTREQLDAQYEELKAALEADPKNPVKMQALADCQARRGFLDEAMALLQRALDQTKEYRYKARMDDLRMAEYRRVIRELEEQLEADPGRTDLKAKRDELVAQRDAFELEVFTERQKQYPTDMAVRYELGLRQLRAGKYDDAIVSFQTATRDPKRRIQSLNMLGKCFFAKKLYIEAQNQFETAIQSYELSTDPLGKELRYNLAKTFEVQGKLAQAVEWYSGIVQQDYQYRDAAKRLEMLRKKLSESQEKT